MIPYILFRTTLVSNPHRHVIERLETYVLAVLSVLARDWLEKVRALSIVKLIDKLMCSLHITEFNS